MPRSSHAWTLAMLCAAAWMFFARPASADPRTAYLAEQLEANDDYRVRTQAALALGASNDDAAVAPLCRGLVDSNVSVRVASAAALGKLGRAGGIGCMQKALAAEAAPSVKAQLQKSISALQSGGGSTGPAAPPPPGPDTKYYVAIQVTNKTARASDEVDALVRGAIQAKLLAMPGFAVAPKDETVTQGTQLVRAKKLKGYFLIATVEQPVYAGGNLTQVVRVSMWTYPDKALQGEFSPKLTQSGTPSTDAKSENVLMQMCSEKAVETFQKVAKSM